MQDFYIQQRTSKTLNADEIQRWFFTVVMLGPQGILMGDDETAEFMLAAQQEDYIYLIVLDYIHLMVLLGYHE